MIGLKENSQKTDRKGTGIMKENRYELNKQLAQMLKGGVIMDVTTPEQAKIAEEAGACAPRLMGHSKEHWHYRTGKTSTGKAISQ